MSEVSWISPFLPRVFDQIPLDTKTLIDLGCGRGIIGALMRIYRQPKRLVGVDIFQPCLDFCKNLNLYDELYKLDLRKLPLPFQNKEFEVATCIETLEHLPKKHGEKLLDEMQRIAKLLIITTPTIFFSQPNYNNDPFQKHVSLWTVTEFKKRNYSVEGFGGFLIKGKRIKFISRFLAPLCRKKFPQFSEFLLIKKQLKV